MIEGEVYSIDIVTDVTAYIFPKGHRVRITVASAAAPYYEPNSNTGKFEPQITKRKGVVASNSVHIEQTYPSSLKFPRVDMGDIPENPHFLSSGLVHV